MRQTDTNNLQLPVDRANTQAASNPPGTESLNWWFDFLKAVVAANAYQAQRCQRRGRSAAGCRLEPGYPIDFIGAIGDP